MSTIDSCTVGPQTQVQIPLVRDSLRKCAATKASGFMQTFLSMSPDTRYRNKDRHALTHRCDSPDSHTGTWATRYHRAR